MTGDPRAAERPPAGDRLVIRRKIRATPDTLFAAWTRPEQVRQWWGPADVTCPAAEIDLTVGGRFRIANRFADGSELWITGRYQRIEPPNLLVFTWRIDGQGARGERVTVRFAPAGGGTDVTVTHERIPDRATRDSHVAGWEGCLDGLAAFALARP